MFSGSEANAYALGLCFFLFFPTLSLALFPFILKLAEFYDFADRRNGSRRYLNKIEVAFSGEFECDVGFDDAQILAGLVNYPDGTGSDILIYSVAPLDS